MLSTEQAALEESEPMRSICQKGVSSVWNSGEGEVLRTDGQRLDPLHKTLLPLGMPHDAQAKVRINVLSGTQAQELRESDLSGPGQLEHQPAGAHLGDSHPE